MPSNGVLVAFLIVLAVAIYLTDYRAHREGLEQGRLEREAEEAARLEVPL
jgi:hypothetical protein